MDIAFSVFDRRGQAPSLHSIPRPSPAFLLNTLGLKLDVEGPWLLKLLPQMKAYWSRVYEVNR